MQNRHPFAATDTLKIRVIGFVLIALLWTVLESCSSSVAQAPSASPPAFPGAEGGGAEAIGGRGGRVIEVTHLNDAGPGSLREALEAEGPRTVVFRVGGTVVLESPIYIETPFITVAGQTAPGGGIQISGVKLETNGSLQLIDDQLL